MFITEVKVLGKHKHGSIEGISVDPDTNEDVKDWPMPMSVTEMEDLEIKISVVSGASNSLR